MWKERTAIMAMLCVTGAASACKEVPLEPFRILIHVDADVGQSLANIPIVYKDPQNPNAPELEVKRTDVSGNAAIETLRPDGESLQLLIRCPADTDAAEPILLTVRRTEGSFVTRFERACHPQIRTVAIVVRAENGPNLPVLYLGQQVARTDAAGAAHFAMKMRTGDTFNVGISTKGDDKLKPRDPSATLTVGVGDEVRLVNVKFEREVPKAVPVYHAPPPRPPQGPRPIP
jgi:hypothetical protein